jgi:long-chain fatty acid transport protein
MRKLTQLFVGLAFVAIPVLAQAQSQLNFTGNGARASAMGYAFTGVADDATAISWNAAGLTQLVAPEASIIGRVSAGNISVEGADYTIDKSSNFNLNFASFVFPLSMGTTNIVVGGAYRNIYDMNRDLTYKSASTDYTVTSSQKGGVYGISPSVAVQFIPNFSIGATFNILTGKQTSSSEVNGERENGESTTKYSGKSLEFGALAKFTNMALGMNYKMPYKLKMADENGDLYLNTPPFFSIGLALWATQNLMFSFDYQARPWSKATISTEESEEGISAGLEDCNSIHVGAELVVNFGGLAIPLRVGFYTTPQPWKDAEDKKITGGMLTLGTGLVLGKVSLDASLEMGGKTYKWGMGDYTTSIPTTTDTDVIMTLGATIGL